MTNSQLLRLLRSVGMGCYVDYHDHFVDRLMSDGKLIAILVEAEGYTPGASSTRVHKAREIIVGGRDVDALMAISRAGRATPRVRTKAQELLHR